MAPLRTVAAIRYVTPLREGGSLPAIVEADDLGTYVLKFRGAGQGPKALLAELVAGQLARALGLPVPEIVLMSLDTALGDNEPDYEIRGLIKASAGVNLALDYLPGSLSYEPGLVAVDADLAASIVWFDALVMNVDRTVRNTNLLVWHRKLHLIDHGAALYFHHDWPAGLGKSRSPFPQIEQHVLYPQGAPRLAAVDESLAARLTDDVLDTILADIPDDWLPAPGPPPLDDSRSAYASFFRERLRSPRPFVESRNARP